MSRNISTKQTSKRLPDDTQLQTLMTDLTEDKEGAIVGGGTRLYVGNLGNNTESAEFVGAIRTTFTF